MITWTDACNAWNAGNISTRELECVAREMFDEPELSEVLADIDDTESFQLDRIFA